jgi:hypothetical protein
MTTYYVLDNGKESGPETADDIVFMVQTGVISSAAQIRVSSDYAWSPVSTILPATTKEPPKPSQCTSCGGMTEANHPRCKHCGELFGVEKRMAKYSKMFEDQDRRAMAEASHWSFAGVAVTAILPGLWHGMHGQSLAGFGIFLAVLVCYVSFAPIGLMVHVAAMIHAAQLR